MIMFVTLNLEVCSNFLMIKMAGISYVDFPFHHKEDSPTLLSSKIWCAKYRWEFLECGFGPNSTPKANS